MFGMLFGVVIISGFYIGLHGRLYLRALKAPVPALVYWPVFWLISCLYILIRWGMGQRTESFLSMAGSYWLAGIPFFVVIFLAFDLVRLANRFLRFLPARFTGPRYTVITGTITLAAAALILAFGTWRARTPVITDYTVSVAKTLPAAAPSIVMVSDIHLGGLIQKDGLAKMVDRINALKPDIILFAGDILDGWLGVYTGQNLGEEMRRLSAPLGVFAVPGNHEYFGANIPEFQKILAADGVRMLIDESVSAGGLTIIGRNDRRGGSRKTIPELVAELTEEQKKQPLVMMDHQPFNLELAEEAGIDLQLSGHTHRGQFWPITMVTKFIFEINYGLLRKGGTTIIVSSGYGLWGPPLRIGSTPEIVRVHITGK